MIRCDKYMQICHMNGVQGLTIEETTPDRIARMYKRWNRYVKGYNRKYGTKHRGVTWK